MIKTGIANVGNRRGNDNTPSYEKSFEIRDSFENYFMSATGSIEYCNIASNICYFISIFTYVAKNKYCRFMVRISKFGWTTK